MMPIEAKPDIDEDYKSFDFLDDGRIIYVDNRPSMTPQIERNLTMSIQIQGMDEKVKSYLLNHPNITKIMKGHLIKT
jgi:hypothetical protein